MKLEELMQELAARLGIGEFELDDDGGAQIEINEELAVDVGCDAGSQALCLSATVGKLPSDGLEAVYAELLEANLMGRGTGGAAFAIDRSLDEIVLCRSITQAGLTFELFEQELVVFIDALRLWSDRHRQDLIGIPEPAVAQSDDNSDDSGSGLMRV